MSFYTGPDYRDEELDEELNDYRRNGYPKEMQEWLDSVDKKIAWENRRIIIKFKVSKYRRVVKRAPKPIGRSKYAERLFEIGAGFND